MCLLEGSGSGGGTMDAAGKGGDGIEGSLPTDSYCECALVPVSSCDDGHLATSIGPWAIQDFMGMAMLGGVEFMRMSVRNQAVMAVRLRGSHPSTLRTTKAGLKCEGLFDRRHCGA